MCQNPSTHSLLLKVVYTMWRSNRYQITKDNGNPCHAEALRAGFFEGRFFQGQCRVLSLTTDYKIPTMIAWLRLEANYLHANPIKSVRTWEEYHLHMNFTHRLDTAKTIFPFSTLQCQYNSEGYFRASVGANEGAHQF